MKLEFVGYLAGFLVAIALAPQVIKTWRTKSTSDISLVWTVILMTGLSLWVTYAVANGIRPLMIFGAIEFLLASTMCAFKIRYRDEPRNPSGFAQRPPGEQAG